MIRFICRESYNLGGPGCAPDVSHRTFTDLCELEAWLLGLSTYTTSREVIGAEVFEAPAQARAAIARYKETTS